MTSEELLKALQAVGILSEDDVRDCHKELAAASGTMTDATPAATRLVKAGKLTNFQAAQALGGKSKALVMGDYVILDKIGAGGMGQVFKAQHRRMKRLVALKLLPASMLKNADSVKRFQREVEAAAKLMHTNIVTAFDAGQSGPSHYLVMEYVEGRDLSAIVKDRGPLPVDEAIQYIRQAAAGLGYAHSRGVVHRDIKPANLLVDKEGSVKILDMGLARLEDDGTAMQEGLTQSGQVMGTVDYMAPEQAFDMKNVDARADIYSLGCSLYRLLVGENMYGGESMMQKFLAHREAPIPDLSGKRNDISPELQAVFARMVAKKPEDRYQTMNEVVAALDMCRSASGSAIATRDMSVTSDWRPGTGPGDSATEMFGNQKLKRIMELDPTLSGLASDSATDPKSQAQLVSPGRKPLGGSRRGKNPPWWTNRNVLIAAGSAGALAALLGVWLIIKNDQGEEVAKVEAVPGVKLPVPAGGTVEVEAKPSTSDVAKPSGAQPASAITQVDDPAFQKWMKAVAELTAYNQVEAVREKLQQLNPGFDGKVTPEFKGRVVTGLSFVSDNVTDVAPVCALVGLQTLNCAGSGAGKGKLADLAPLLACKNMTTLKIKSTQVTPGAVAALQMALANCKIEWDGPTKDVGRAPPTIAGQNKVGGAHPTSPAASQPSTAWPFDPNDGREYVWSEPENLGPTINGPDDDVVISLTPDQRRLFYRTKDGRAEMLAEASRTSSAEPFGKSKLCYSGSGSSEPGVSGDGLTLATGSNAFQIRSRPTLDTPWSKPVDLGPLVHLQANGRWPALSSDGLTLLFSSGQNSASRPGLWMSRRKSQAESFGPAKEVDPASASAIHSGLLLADGQTVVYRQNGKLYFRSLGPTGITAAVPLQNQPFANEAQKLFGLWLTPDGRTAYFSADRPGGLGGNDIWVIRRVPKNSPSPLAGEGPAVRGTNVVYLDDLTWLEQSAYGKVQGHGMAYGGQKPFQWHGATPAHSLYTEPRPKEATPAYVVYALAGRYDTFQAEIGLTNGGPQSPLTFRVLGDGKPLFEKRGIRDGQVGEPVSVSVRGVAKLRLEVVPEGPQAGNCHAVWIDPRLTPCAGPAMIPAEALTFGGHHYLLVADPGNWIEAKAKAEAMGGHLVAITTPEERDWIKENIWLKRPNQTDADSCYLGGVSRDTKTWSWVTGEPVEMTLWSGKKGPDDPHPSDFEVIVWAGRGGNWDDRPAGKKQQATHFLVEWDTLGVATSTPANAPAIDDALDRKVARWLLDHRLNCVVVQGTKKTTLKPGDKLPDGKLVFGGIQSAPAVSIQHDELLSGIRDFQRLNQFKFSYLPPRDADVWAEAFAAMPTIESVNAAACDLTDAGLARLTDLPKLGYLNLGDCSKVTSAGLAALLRCQSLNTLELDQPAFEMGVYTLAHAQALQDALPKCRVQFSRGQKIPGLKPAQSPPSSYPGLALDKAAKPTSAKWDTPAFQKWVAETQKLPAEKQIEAVSKKLMELNPGFDGKVTGGGEKAEPKIDQGVVTEFGFVNTRVTDISPVRAFVRLNVLWCAGRSYSVNNKLSDLSPLQGMGLTSLNCGNSQVADLSPLRGMPLTELHCGYTATLTDLSPLKGMPLTILSCHNSHVADLSPLEDCKSLKSLGLRHAPVTAASVAALAKSLPNCRISWDDPAKSKTPEPAASGTK